MSVLSNIQTMKIWQTCLYSREKSSLKKEVADLKAKVKAVEEESRTKTLRMQDMEQKLLELEKVVKEILIRIKMKILALKVFTRK